MNRLASSPVATRKTRSIFIQLSRGECRNFFLSNQRSWELVLFDSNCVWQTRHQVFVCSCSGSQNAFEIRLNMISDYATFIMTVTNGIHVTHLFVSVRFSSKWFSFIVDLNVIRRYIGVHLAVSILLLSKEIVLRILLKRRDVMPQDDSIPECERYLSEANCVNMSSSVQFIASRLPAIVGLLKGKWHGV